MATKRKTKKKPKESKRAGVLERPQPNGKEKGVRLTNAKLRELAQKHKPPQSWYDHEEEGLY
jgi:hypothetical protein